jgi:proteasome alpha subunit
VLDRARPRRKFRRLTGAALGRLLGESDTGAADADEATNPPTALAGGSHEPPGPAATDDAGDADPA